MCGVTVLFNRILSALVIALMSCAAAAEQSVDLYRADTLVKSQSEAQRAVGAKRALADTLVRVSGVPAAGDNPVVRQALTRAQDYVFEYSYHSTDDTLPGTDGDPVPASLLRLKFSPVQIETLLRDAGLTFWPANRPTVLVWLAVNTDAGLEVVSDTDRWEPLREAARARGLPIMAPVFDLEDHLALPAEALWRMDEPAIRQASERYRPDAILVVRYSTLSNGVWRGNWQLLHGEGDLASDGQAEQAGALLVRAVGDVANRFAALYAITPSESGTASLVMRVDNVDDFGTFKAIERYLSKLALVRRVELGTLAGRQVWLRLFTEGDLARLENTLALDGQLAPVDGSSLPANRYQLRGTEANPLVYRWYGK